MSCPIPKYLPSPISLAEGSCVRKPPSFPTNRSPITAKDTHFMYIWRAVWCLLNGLGRRLVSAALSGFFHEMKVDSVKGVDIFNK